MKMLETDSLEDVIQFTGKVLGNPLLYFENSISPTIESNHELVERYLDDRTRLFHDDKNIPFTVDPQKYLDISETIARSNGAFL